LALIGILVVVVVTVVLAAFGILRRSHEATVLADRTTRLAAPSVIAATPRPGAPVDNFVLPGNVTSYTDSPIYARTSGYLTRWYFDIGAKVKKGALQADRYTGLVKTEAVSRQDTDTFVNLAASTAAQVRSAQANVQRLTDLQSFEKVYAPFDGVVTARNIDTGQLIDPGAGKELFHLQAIQTLRVYANLPQFYSQSVKRGDKIDLTFAEHPGKTFQGTLVRTADAIDPASRTLLVEIDVNNRADDLLPGSLAQVHFKTPPASPTFVVPVSALIFRKEGLRIATVVNGSQAHLIPVIIGEDDGANVQIVTGLTAADQVIQDPPDSIIEGEKVFVVPAAHGETGGK
jgi:RND family efflux transporter MFP subunit